MRQILDFTIQIKSGGEFVSLDWLIRTDWLHFYVSTSTDKTQTNQNFITEEGRFLLVAVSKKYAETRVGDINTVQIITLQK